jgi:hypothetical protein
MPVSAHNVTTKKDIVKELQYVTEGNTVTTPSNYGVTPNSSTFTLVGNNIDLNINPDVKMFTVDVLGTEDIIDAVKTESLYAFTIKFNPIDTNLWRYIWNASGQTVSPDSSLSFTYSFYLGGTEYYQHMRGCRATSGTLSMRRGAWECDMTFVAKDITIPSTTTGDGGTPVYQTSETSASPIIHTDGGGSPFTWNSATYGERSFSTTVTREMAVMAVNGETDITYCEPVARRITFNADVFAGTTSQLTTMYSDFESKIGRTASYKFTSSPSKTLTFSNARITDYSYSHAAGSNDALIESITAVAESVTDL